MILATTIVWVTFRSKRNKKLFVTTEERNDLFALHTISWDFVVLDLQVSSVNSMKFNQLLHSKLCHMFRLIAVRQPVFTLGQKLTTGFKTSNKNLNVYDFNKISIWLIAPQIARHSTNRNSLAGNFNALRSSFVLTLFTKVYFMLFFISLLLWKLISFQSIQVSCQMRTENRAKRGSLITYRVSVCIDKSRKREREFYQISKYFQRIWQHLTVCSDVCERNIGTPNRYDWPQVESQRAEVCWIYDVDQLFFIREIHFGFVLSLLAFAE